MSLPIAYPRHTSFRVSQKLVLAADVGGTKTNMALFRITNNKMEVVREHTFKSAIHSSMEEIIAKFKAQGNEVFHSVSLAIAGPVYKGKAHGTNLPWDVEEESIRKAFNLEEVYLLNDLEANAYGLSALEGKDLLPLYEGDPTGVGNIAIISPGTGLGEAGMYFDGTNFHPFATEGGHCDFAPQNELDVEMLHYLQRNYDHVSWERLISGPGILHIFQFFRYVKKMEVPAWLDEAMEAGELGHAISKGAMEDSCEVCQATIDLFLRYLAEESGNLILKFKATGGLYIGGGIVPDLIGELDVASFLRYLQNSGRMEHLLKQVPVSVIMNEKTALLGAAFYGF
jgi:glucokinase